MHPVGLRIELAERQVLQLLAHLVHADAAGERRVDVDRLLGAAPARLRRHVVERAHVVQAVGELDQQHAHVLGDREQELAQVLGLLGLARDEVEPLELGEALDQAADVLAEQLVDLGAGRLGVLDRVVQQRRHDGGVVELEVGEDRRDLERMGEIGIARGAQLLAMRLHGVDIGAVEQLLVGVRIVFADPLDQLVLPHHLRLGLRGAAGSAGFGAIWRPRSAGARARGWCCMRGRSVDAMAILGRPRARRFLPTAFPEKPARTWSRRTPVENATDKPLQDAARSRRWATRQANMIHRNGR